MLASRRELLTGVGGVALVLPLAGCFPASTVSIDPSTISIVQAVTVAARGFCAALPTAETISQIVLALALPAGLPVQQIASVAAHTFCDSLPKAAKMYAAKRRAEPGTGRPIIDYGPVIINGKQVNIATYA